MRRGVLPFASLAAALSLGGLAPETSSAQEAARTPAVITDAETWTVTSSTNSRRYQVSVAVPRGYHGGDQTYPVLFVMDANGQFGMATDIARWLAVQRDIRDIVVVGVGYPVGHFWDAVGLRTLDLTPTADQPWVEEFARMFPSYPAPEGSGGAPEFLAFLRNELIPYIEAHYRVQSDGRALLGHSFGGLFALHALFFGEGTFSRFVVGSPAIWWDHDITFRHEEEFTAGQDSLGARVFLSVGLSEEPEDGSGLAPYRMVTNVRTLAETLTTRQYRGLEVRTHFFEGETHMSVVPATISRGLRYIYTTR
ncbi:MAG: alpha/beta hydrolase-fold protein [Gemmatimonadota bacterium]